jgi:hypothetical protein
VLGKTTTRTVSRALAGVPKIGTYLTDGRRLVYVLGKMRDKKWRVEDCSSNLAVQLTDDEIADWEIVPPKS